MKQPNPLVPQGTFESQARGKSHVRIAVFTILAIHVVVLGALLIQGCKRDKEDTSAATSTDTNTSAIPPYGDTNAIVSTPPTPNTNPAAPANGTTGFAPNGAAPITPTTPTPPIVPTTPTTPATGLDEGGPATEHVIVKGDTFDSIARKYGVTVKAIQAANPNLSPTRLKLGDKVKVPAKTASTAGASSSGAIAANGSSDTYTVKAGDTLGKVAKAHGTTVKELQKLNNLSTTQIRVNQKLKVPQRAASAPATLSPTPATPLPSTPAPGGTPAPAQ
jgi:LysM repeat protein